MMKHTRAVGITACMAFAVCQTGTALAYGPYEQFGGHNSVNAMMYFHVPLGTSTTEKDRAASLAFTVKSEFLFLHPGYQRERGEYFDSTSTTFNLMGLRFGMNGKLSGLDLGGLTALGAKAPLN